MKSAKTMLAQARAKAINEGIRCVTDQHGRTSIGFAFSLSEVSQIYLADGFTLKTMHKHIDTWAQLGLVIPVGKIWFIRLLPSEREAIADLDEERRMRQIHGDLDCIYVSEASA